MDMDSLQRSHNETAKRDKIRLEFKREYRSRVFNAVHPVTFPDALSLEFHIQRYNRFRQWKKAVLALCEAKISAETPPWLWTDVVMDRYTRKNRVAEAIHENVVSSRESADNIAEVLLSGGIAFPKDWIEKVLRLLGKSSVPADDYELLLLLTLIEGTPEELTDLVELPRAYLYHMLGTVDA